MMMAKDFSATIYGGDGGGHPNVLKMHEECFEQDGMTHLVFYYCSQDEWFRVFNKTK